MLGMAPLLLLLLLLLLRVAEVVVRSNHLRNTTLRSRHFEINCKTLHVCVCVCVCVHNDSKPRTVCIIVIVIVIIFFTVSGVGGAGALGDVDRGGVQWSRSSWASSYTSRC